MVTYALPQIRPLSDLRTHMGEITALVDKEQKPVVLTKHGRGKYVLLAADAYDELTGRRQELYRFAEEGRRAVEEGRTRPFADFMQELKQDIAHDTL